MDTFAALKKNRKSEMEKLTEEMNKLSQKVYDREDDERFWRPEQDKAGNGNAIIRFLPAPPGEDLPYVRYWEHSFKGPVGNWFIELCPTTIGKQCPVCQHNNGLWNSGRESDKAIVTKQKRRLRFISNILILKDTAHPENEGTVKLYRYGKKIFDKINELMHPDEIDDRPPINPFDMWEGATFKLKVRTVEGYPNYDKSEFDKPSAISDNDKYLEELWKQEHSLKTFISEDLFKSEAELKNKMNRVLSAAVSEQQVREPKVSKEITPKENLSWDGDDEFGEDYFKNIMNADE